MPENKPVPLMLSIPKSFRDKLRKMAAEQNLKTLIRSHQHPQSPGRSYALISITWKLEVEHNSDIGLQF